MTAILGIYATSNEFKAWKRSAVFREEIYLNVITCITFALLSFPCLFKCLQIIERMLVSAKRNCTLDNILNSENIY